MKKLILILLATFLFCSKKSIAQVTFDHEVDSTYIGYWFRAVQISSSETKWYFADTLTNTFSLFNMDWSLFLANIPVPEPMGLDFQVLYVSRTLFDCDSTNIEYMYEAPINNTKTFRIMRTDGTVLLSVDSANAPYCFGSCGGGGQNTVPIINTSDSARLFVQKYTLGYQQIFIYSLCGSLPTDVFDFSLGNHVFVKIFPNPSSETLTFEINPPDNQNLYDLVILDSDSKELKREKITAINQRFTMSVKDFASGTYLYQLASKDKISQSGKFIVAK